MTTREENLKKINDALEKLSDDELDKIDGGTCYQTAKDSRFLNSLNGSTDRYGEFKVSGGAHNEEIRQAWKKVGVIAEINCTNLYPFVEAEENRYYVNGVQVSQEQARQHAMKVTGHFMKRSEWDW